MALFCAASNLSTVYKMITTFCASLKCLPSSAHNCGANETGFYWAFSALYKAGDGAKMHISYVNKEYVETVVCERYHRASIPDQMRGSTSLTYSTYHIHAIFRAQLDSLYARLWKTPPLRNWTVADDACLNDDNQYLLWYTYAYICKHVVTFSTSVSSKCIINLFGM